MRPSLISIAIVTRNRATYVSRCLLSLQKQKKEFVNEIVVVDNDSTDETKEVIDAYKKVLPIRYVVEKKIGIPYARNRALREAKGELLAFIDDDCEASPTWIEEMVKVHRKYPKAAAIQGKVTFVPQESIFADSFSLNYNFWIWRSIQDKNRITICDTSNILFLIKEIKSSDIQFDINLSRGSDVDFGKQLLEKKKEIIYGPKIIVFVSVRNTIIGMFKQRYLIGMASKKLENKWGLSPSLSSREFEEYRKRLKMFGQNKSFFQQVKLFGFFYIYKPFYHLGRMQIKSINDNLSGRNSPQILEKDKIFLNKGAKEEKKIVNITVAIVTRNRKESLSRTLKSIILQKFIPQEVLIVDNGSTDETKEVINSFQDMLRITYLYESKIGVAFARNRALREAKGKLLAFIDDDCEASPTWIEEMIKAHRRYPDAAAIQGECIVFPPRGAISTVLQYLYTSWIEQYLYGRKLFVLDTANASFKLKSIRNAKLFFDTDFLSACDDIDFCFTLWEAKLPIYYVPFCVVYSYRPMSKIALIQQRFEKGKARAMLDKKWKIERLHKSFSINGIKYIFSSGELQQKYHEDSRIDLRYRSKWGALKTSIFLFLFKFIFRMSYRWEKGKFTKNALYASYALSHRQAIKLSIGIVTRNRATKLKQVLESLVYQTVRPGEVLVVDNGSTDETKKVVVSFKAKLPVRYVQESKVGIAYARNRALQEAKGELLAFIDDDCEASPTWIEEMVKANKKYPKAVAIQGKSVYKPEKAIKSSIVSISYNQWLKIHRYKKNRLLVLDTKNVLLQREKIKKLEIQFDTDFTRSSDVDFGKQLIKKGEEIIYEEQIVIYHYERERLFEFLKKYHFMGKGKAMLEYKWPEKPKNSVELHKEIRDTLKIVEGNGGIIRKWLFIILYKTSQFIFYRGYNQGKYSQRLLKVKQPDKTPVNFSVGIVTKNRPQNLYRCLFSLTKQSCLPKEILVVDSSFRKEKTQTILDQFQHLLSIQYIYESPQGIGHARNTVLEKAKGALIAFIDDDCEAGSTWIEEMIKAHRRYPDAAAIQGKVFFIPFKGLLTKVCQDEYDHWFRKNVQKNGNFLSLDFENTSFKNVILTKLKVRCDTRYKRHYYDDDVDFGYQLLFLNQSIKYYPRAYVFAKRKRTFYALLLQKWLKGRSRAVLDIKWNYLYDTTAFYLGKKRIFFSLKTFEIKDNPFFIDTRHHVSSIIVSLYPFMRKLFQDIYIRGYTFERMFFEHDYTRLSQSLLSKRAQNNGKLTVSVMIITKDRKTLQRALASLVAQTIRPREVIIVDSSRSSIQDALGKYQKALDIQYVYQPHLGFGIARNTAMKKAIGDIVATLDDDAQADTHWVENIIKMHITFPFCVAVQGRIVSKPEDSSIALVEQLHIERWFLRRLDQGNNIKAISTKNVSFKRKEFFRHRLRFNEKKLYGIYGSEDIDIAYQIMKKGLQILYEATIIVYHWERATLKEYLMQQKRKGTSSALIGKDWPEMTKGMKTYFPFPKILQPIASILSNPITKKKLYLYPYIYIIFSLADLEYMRGKARMEKMENVLKKKKEIVPVTVIILLKLSIEKIFFQQILSIMDQSYHPERIILVKKAGVYSETLDICIGILPTIRVVSTNEFIKKDIVIKNIKGKIVTFLDEYAIPSQSWLENIVKAHYRYPDRFIQGMTKLSKTYDAYNTVVQFNRQTVIRNTMFENKNLYSKWLCGEVKTNFYIRVHDIYNISVKIENNKDRIATITSYFMNNSLSVDMDHMYKEKVLLLPEIILSRTRTSDFKSFIQYAHAYGRIYHRDNQYGNPIRKIGAFVYYCLRNNIFLQLPLVVVYFVFFQLVFLYSMHVAQKNSYIKRIIPG